jgi:hypothetical protein
MSIQLAKIERLYAEAQSDQTAAAAHSQTLSDRLADIRQRQSDITSRRLAGTANDRDASEFAALTGDEQALNKMLATAKAAQALTADKTLQALTALEQAQKEHAHGQAVAKYQALLDQCTKIEKVFCKAIGETGRAGKAIGHFTLNESYKQSGILDRALRLNVCPLE